MKLIAKYKDGTLVLDRPINPKSDTVHIEILEDDLVVGQEKNAPSSQADLEIRRLIMADPFYARLWRNAPAKVAPPHSSSDDDLLWDSISDNQKYFPSK